MRWLLVLLAACTTHPGTYLDVHGGTLQFDHVEFYFGRAIGDTFGTPTQKDVGGDAYARQLADSDLSVAAKAGVTTELTYYLPYSDGNAKLGDYVVAIAKKGGQPVGIGEASGFPVPDSGYALVDITLEPYSDSAVETWQDCLAWKRSHGESPVAFVHADDRDCDGEVASRDCADTEYCAPSDASCQPARELCTGTTCAYGCRINGTCTARLCMPIFVCNPALCQSAQTVVEKFACLSVSAGADHPDYFLDSSAGQLCGDPLEILLPNGATCANPVLEFVQEVDNWQVTVAASPDGKACVLQFSNATANAPWNGDHHVVISFDGAMPDDPRPTIFLGIKANNTGCGTSTAPTGPLAINACQ